MRLTSACLSSRLPGEQIGFMRCYRVLGISRAAKMHDHEPTSQPWIEQAASLFGVALTVEQAEQFDVYARELAVWNENINLTAIVEPEAVRVRHFLDSLSLVKVA